MKKHDQNILIALFGVGLVGNYLAKRGASLGKIEKTKPPGNTKCADGTYSTFPTPWPGGVCSYHGGRAVVNLKKKAGKAKAHKKNIISFSDYLIPVINRLEDMKLGKLRSSLNNLLEKLKETPIHHNRKREELTKKLNNVHNAILNFGILKENPILLNQWWYKYHKIDEDAMRLNWGNKHISDSIIVKYNGEHGTRYSAKDLGVKNGDIETDLFREEVLTNLPEPEQPEQKKSKRLDILKKSLAKKEQVLDDKFKRHFEDVKSAHGQPLNDKRGGPATMRRWDRQSDSLRNQQAEIEKTKQAIEREEGKIIDTEYAKNSMPQPILNLINDGTLKQWRRHPNFLFVEGVDKGRLVWRPEEGKVYYRYLNSIKDKEQYKKFATVFNLLNNAINKKGTVSGLGAVFPRIPKKWYECTDGTYTTTRSRNACSWHGGLKTGQAVAIGPGAASSLQVADVPLSQIKSKPEWFQNRTDAYSTRSVQNIVSAVLEGKFNWSSFDPVQLWAAPDGNIYILSGHSRKEAFKRLSAMGAEVDGRKFDTIPAKIDSNLTLEQAQKVARESNTLGTPETVLERADYYRAIRQTGNTTLRQLTEAAKKTEGRNANTVLALSFLNPFGKTYQALKALQGGQTDSFENIEKLARWIGAARMNYPMLTNAHEDELFNWLVRGGGYGRGPGQVSNERDFLNEIYRIVQKNTTFGEFAVDSPLNIQRSRHTNPVEAQYNQQLAELDQEISKLNREKNQKIKQYAKEATPEQLRQILASIEAGLRVKQQRRQQLVLSKDSVMTAAKQQTALFGFPRMGRISI